MIMKNYKIYTLALLLGLGVVSCNYLDVIPDNVATLDYAFRDRNGAMKYLATCYNAIPSHSSWNSSPGIAGSDEYCHYAHMTTNRAWRLAAQNSNDPFINEWGGNLYKGIRNCNTFFENIDKVQNGLPEDEKLRMIAEVKILKAYYHFYLLRMYGPIVLVDKNLPISASSEEVALFRSPFDDCVQYISDLLDEAISCEFLPETIVDKESEWGRMSKVIAYTLKTDLWMTAASPLFNGNEDYINFTDKRGVKLFSQTYDKNKWVIARQAAEEAIKLAEKNGSFELYKYNPASSEMLSDSTQMLESLRGAVSAEPLLNNETIFASQNNPQDLAKQTMPYFTANQDINWIWSSANGYCPPLHIVEKTFFTNKGIPIEYDKTYPNKENLYGWTTTNKVKDHRYYVLKDEHGTANLHLYREPRFYANIGFDGCIWYGNGRYKEHESPGTSATETSWRLRTRAGVCPGKVQSVRYSITGYFIRKYGNIRTAGSADGTKAIFQRYNFPIYRLADLYLMYTECANEASEDGAIYGASDPIYTYIDKVRNRAGLEGVVESWNKYSTDPTKPLSKEGFREVIKMERASELCFEGKRYWDLRRWKELLTLNSIKFQGWDINQMLDRKDPAKGNDFFYTIKDIERVQLSTRNYLWPIRLNDLRKNLNLCQNPGW